jgi:allophanate hydrolase subunit 2
VPPSGPMDSISHRKANFLVGNNISDAAIEILLDGLEVKFYQLSLAAVSGSSEAEIYLKDKSQLQKKVLFEKPLLIQPGETLLIKNNRKAGARTYLAVRGGI